MAEHDPRFPQWSREGEFLYRRRRHFSGIGVRPWREPFSPEADEAEDLVFYDTETTGLSGGAGSFIFLFGAAWNEGPDLAVEQLFLSDFPGEPEFLSAVDTLFGRFKAFVSYNGKTFDSHLLMTRFLMNRIPWEPGPQVDLLHHARRLWKTATGGDCSLQSIERRILGVTRELDVAGEDIPLAWYEFLKTGNPGVLPVVFDHNAMDITSLARLYSVIGRVLDGDELAAPIDARTLGRWMLRRAPENGVSLLADAFARGATEAGGVLSLHYKGRGNWDQAVAVWKRMMADARSMFAAVELAKYHEHRERDPAAALAVLDMLAGWNLPHTPREREELKRRRERLLRKSTRG
jgi:uncharacterized protein YprB with RNaseH-like and TPR domain